MKRLDKILKFLNKYKFVIAIVAIITLLVLNWLFTSRGGLGGSSTNNGEGTSTVTTTSSAPAENKLSLLNALPKYGQNFAADFAPFDTDQSVTPTITVHLENTSGRAEFDAWLENYVYPADTVFVFTEGEINMD